MKQLLRFIEILAAVGIFAFAMACASSANAPGPQRGEVMDVKMVRSFQGDVFYELTIGIQVLEQSYEQFTIRVPHTSIEAMLFAVPGRCVMVSRGSMVNSLRLRPCRD